VRDGVYTAGVTRAAGSTLVTSVITTSNRQTLDGASYALQIGAVNTDPVTGATSVEYTLTRTDRNGTVTTVPPPPPALPGDPYTSATVGRGQPIPITIQQGGADVVSFTLTGTPAAGDSVSMQPSSSLMGTLDAAIRGIAGAADTVDAAQAVSQALANIDAGMERLHNMRGYAGELLNRADRIASDQETRSVQLEGDRSRAEDLDMIRGISDFQNAHVGYQAALQSYAQVQKLSLLDFMR